MTRLTLFGGAALLADSGPLAGRAAQRHRIALLALLSSTRQLFRSREKLATLLWPEADTEHGRRLLSDSIYRINLALGGDVIAGTGEDLRLHRAQLASDVAEFEAAIESCDWRRAAELYAGPFMDGFFLPEASAFDQWMEGERQRYARAAARALEMLATGAQEEGRPGEAVEWWQRVAALAPDDSRVAMALMRALAAAGNRAGAVRHARVHGELLRESLGVEPDPAVMELASELAERRVTPSRAPAIAPGPETAPAERVAPAAVSSIAVLPFSSLSEADNGYFADGMSEELMYLLTRQPGLRVASRTSAFACRDLKLDVREVAARLQVAWIVEGSVRRSGDTLRIVAQLIDARDGYQAWSESFDRSSSDIFAIQRDIAGAIAGRILPALGAHSMPLAALEAGAASHETFDLYLQARYQWHRRTEESLLASAALFEQVVARDPGFARAWVGLADAHAVLAFYDYLPPRIAFPRADAAARHAALLDPGLAGPHATLAYIDTYYRWDFTSAERGFLRAIELEPADATAHQWYACLLTARGRYDEAEREMRRACELDPLSMIAVSAMGWVLMFAGECTRAIEHLQRALDLDRGFCLAHYWMGLAHLRSARPHEAIPILSYVLDPAGGAQRCSMSWSTLARAHAEAGHEEAARAILHELLRMETEGRYVSSFQLAKLYQALGDQSEALARLERAYAERAHSLVFLATDPQFRSMAREPRFRRLVELMEQPAVLQAALPSGPQGTRQLL